MQYWLWYFNEDYIRLLRRNWLWIGDWNVKLPRCWCTLQTPQLNCQQCWRFQLLGITQTDSQFRFHVNIFEQREIEAKMKFKRNFHSGCSGRCSLLLCSQYYSEFLGPLINTNVNTKSTLNWILSIFIGYLPQGSFLFWIYENKCKF